jgi:glycerol-3-phosphate dehydrogenase
MIDLPESCDLVIVGGGITGAGIFHETARMGLKVVLLEQHDFAWGTSSRSSKLIHGGLRYLKEGHVLLTRDAVKERERLLREAPGLVRPIPFVLPIYKDRGPGRWTLQAGLSVYDLLAQKRRHRRLAPEEVVAQVPFIERKDLLGGYEFWDAQVDDARLVLRLIREGRQAGGVARNYTVVRTIERDAQGMVRGVVLQDMETQTCADIESSAVINATGCWAECLHPQVHAQRHMRPLRGSHLFFPHSVLPVQCAVSFTHPEDQRPVFVIPWEAAVLVGTTDLDHTPDLALEPTITRAEADYLLAGARALFPSLGLSLDQCLAAQAGLRPVISSNSERAPSEESREHDIWVDNGLVTIAGGKLTTYRRVALDALKAAQPFLSGVEKIPTEAPGFETAELAPPNGAPEAETWQRLTGRYGQGAYAIVAGAKDEDLQCIPGTRTLWAELPYVAGESVRHLSDLMLRRVRIGLLLPEGGKVHLNRIGRLIRPVLGWNRRHWRREVKAYRNHWRQAHGFSWQTPVAGRLRRCFQWLKTHFGRRVSGPVA